MLSTSFDSSSFQKVDWKFSELFSREIFQLQDLGIKKHIKEAVYHTNNGIKRDKRKGQVLKKDVNLKCTSQRCQLFIYEQDITIPFIFVN